MAHRDGQRKPSKEELERQRAKAATAATKHKAVTLTRNCAEVEEDTGGNGKPTCNCKQCKPKCGERLTNNDLRKGKGLCTNCREGRHCHRQERSPH